MSNDANDANEEPFRSAQNPTDSPPPTTEPVSPPSAENELAPPSESAEAEPPGAYAPPPPPMPGYDAPPQNYPPPSPPPSGYGPAPEYGAPPQGYSPTPTPPPAYGAPPQGYPPPPPGYAASYGAQVAAQPPVPAGINGLWQKFINVTTKPGAQSFTNELPTANWSDIWIALLGLGVITALTGFIHSLYVQAALAANYPLVSGLTPDQQHAMNQILSNTGSGAANFGAIIWTPVGFFIGMGILFVSAKIFRGSGSFLDQSYAFMLYYVPINGLGAILGLIPVLGGFASFALAIYSVVLAVFAMMASQRLTGGRATAAVLLPAAIVTLVICGILTVLVVALATLIHGTH